LRVAQELQLTEQRHGLRGKLRVLLDSRLPKSSMQDARGYSPMMDEPRAAALVRVQRADGMVLDELTLYPALDITATRLAGARDTFLATEHVACQSGRFCGWHTRLFELRSGKLTRVRALGNAGTQRNVETTASFAARWTFRRGAQPGTRDLLSQEEDPQKFVWVERRFFYARGAFRFSEREAPTNDPQMLAEPGSWSGRLD
jgi:hypothetical protein